jgi:hypothetical protein
METTALVNRPLPSLKEGFVPIYNKRGNPIASEDINKSDLLNINTKYSEKDDALLPISIEQDKVNNEFMILEGNIFKKVEEYAKNDKKGILNETSKKEFNLKNKMNFTTQFYVGSLTVVGLYIFYKLIQRSK